MSRNFFTDMPVIQLWNSPTGSMISTINFSEEDNQPVIKWRPERITQVPSILLNDGSIASYPLGYRITGSVSFQIWQDEYLKHRRSWNVKPQVTEYELELIRWADVYDFPILFFPHGSRAGSVYDDYRRVEVLVCSAERPDLAQDRVSGVFQFQYLKLTPLFSGYSDNL